MRWRSTKKLGAWIKAASTSGFHFLAQFANTLRRDLKAVELSITTPWSNQKFIPNYGERYRNGERIASGFVESAVNQVISKRMSKRQQMQWTQRGAHLLLQIRTRVLNEEWEHTFRRWYPGFRLQTSTQPLEKAA